MIPKLIHYVWVGGNPLDELALKCIASWKKFCPDYEIIEWNEKNFDVNQNLYCKQAYEKKKWAFASDYIRLKVLFDNGGVYMDTDVEVIKPIDEFLSLPAFSGFENDKNIPTGLIACQKGNLWVKRMLEFYDDAEFVNLATNVETITRLTKEMYPQILYNNTEQHFNHFSVFPKDYFCANCFNTRKTNITENTHTIHWFNGSWVVKRTFFQKANANMKHFSKETIKFIIGKRLTEKIKNKRKMKRKSQL